MKKQEIVNEAISIIEADEQKNLSRALHEASKSTKPYNYKEIQDEYSLLNFMPSTTDRNSFWWDFDKDGQKQRASALRKLIGEVV